MKAAVLHTLGKAPRFEDFSEPQAGDNEAIVHVKAASLKNSDKAMASGSHYDSYRELPVICGIDGVGVLDDGTRVFCGGCRPPYGMMAESDALRLIEIGEMAGPTISLSAAALRSSGIEIYGSGGGSIPHTAIFDAFPQVWALAAEGKLRVDTETVPLADVESAWQRNDLSGRRLVIIP